MSKSPGVHFPASRSAGRSQRLFLLEARERNRRIQPGFPVTEPFHTPEDALAYLDNAKLTCLLCGRELVMLAKHLLDIHAITAEEYKQRYHLPLTRGLVGNATRKVMSQRMRERVESGEVAQDMNALQKLAARAPRKQSAYKGKVDEDKSEAFHAYNDLIRKQPTACKRCGEDIPSNHVVYCSWDCRYHPDQQKTDDHEGGGGWGVVEHECKTCRRAFIAEKSLRRRFCSRQCAGKARRMALR